MHRPPRKTIESFDLESFSKIPVLRGGSGKTPGQCGPKYPTCTKEQTHSPSGTGERGIEKI